LGTYDATIQFLASNFFLVGANILGLWSCYRLEYFARRDYALRRTVEAEQRESERLLLNILPDEIAARLKSDPGTIAAAFPQASILFADIVASPGDGGDAALELIDLLNEVFYYFDGLVEKHGIEKIKTIGDCYMAAAGVPVYRQDHAQALARMALEVTDYAATHTFGGRRLAFRIGINSGPVIAGVIGRMKFSYDLWGDTVNLASRMESQGRKAASRSRSRPTGSLGRLRRQPRGTLKVKGIGEVEVWHLVGEKAGQDMEDFAEPASAR
jgi:guanylate cyclase